MTNESLLSIVIDSLSAEQRAKDLAVVLDAATKAGINVNVSAENAYKPSQAKPSLSAWTRIDRGVVGLRIH